MTAKDEVLEVLKNLPDDCTLEDVQYSLYVRQRINRGLEDDESGRVVSHSDVRQRLARRVEYRRLVNDID